MSDHSVILLVEDRQDDVVLIRKAFQNAYLNNPLHVVADGEEAMAYLIGEGKYSNRAEHPLPELILLTISLNLNSRVLSLQSSKKMATSSIL